MIQSVNKYHIYEVLSADGNFYYTIPKYQREYTWSYREWEALYDDISENNDEYSSDLLSAFHWVMQSIHI